MDTRSGPLAVCPRLIGRTGNVAVLADLASQVGAGRGQTILIAGEAGIGKSRLVAEALAQAAAHRDRAAPTLVLRGQCFEPDRACPYALILDLLRNDLTDRAPEAIAGYLGPAASEIGKLLPELAPILPDVRLSAPLAPEHEKRRLFHVLFQFLARLAAAQPLLFIAEDLHWSDDTSLEFLLALARRVPTQRILLLLTYRSDEIHPGLRHALADCDRERLAVEMALARLNRAEVEAMLRAMLRGASPLRADIVDAIFALTDGNPFFVEEVLRSLAAAGQVRDDGSFDAGNLHELVVPRTVLDAVHLRLASLSPAARRVLDFAAVAGRRFDFAVLRDLTMLDDDALLARIKEAIAAQLVVEESSDRFAFRHALTRQAVYGRLLVRECQTLHRAIAERLESVHAVTPERSPDDLAYHCFEAGDWSKAVAFFQIAADRALAVEASGAAIVHVNRALAASANLRAPPLAAHYRARGLAYETLGDFDRARTDFQASLDRARAVGNRRAEWRALLDLGALSTGHDYQMAGHYFRAATGLAESLPNRTPYAQSLNRLANWHVNTGDIPEAIRLHRQALDLFDGTDDRQAAETFDLLGMAHGMGGDPHASVDSYDLAIERFRDIGDRRGLLAALTGRLVWKFGGHFSETVICPSPDVAAMRADVAEALELAHALGWPAMASFVHLAAGPNLEQFGFLGEGLDHLHEALRLAREIGHQQWIAATRIHLSRVHRSLLDGERAVRTAEEGLADARMLGSVIWITVGASYLALAHLLNRQPDRAEAVLTTIPRPPLLRSLPERLLTWAWGEVALARGDAATALTTADVLRASVPGAPADQPIPGLLKLRGDALLALDRPVDAVEVLADAKRGAIERRAVNMQWRVQRSYAMALKAAGRAEEAACEAAEAGAVVVSLSTSIDDEAMRRHFLSAAHASLGVVPAKKSLRAPLDFLTPREREIAHLLARRLSNREIAEALFVGERTVETHVSHILSKLGCASRTDVATRLAEHGPVERPDRRLPSHLRTASRWSLRIGRRSNSVPTTDAPGNDRP